MRNETLQDINQSISSLDALEQRRMRLLERIGVSRDQLKERKTIYNNKEIVAQKRMKRGSSTAFLRLFNRYGNSLDRQTIELMAARFEYEKEKDHIKDLEEENEDLLRRISNLNQRKKIMQDEINRRETEISQNKNHDLYEQYKRILVNSTETAAQLVENEEALRAAQKVLGTAKASQEELENAQQWITSEMWSGSGLVSRTTKLSKIDHAQSTFSRLSSQIQELELELSHVQLEERTILTTISSANHMVEFWFDNILSSKDVSSVLRDNQIQIRILITQTTDLIGVLEKNEEEKQSHLAQYEQDKANLLVTCRSCEGEDGEEARCGIPGL
jgi:hypothetical protein